MCVLLDLQAETLMLSGTLIVYDFGWRVIGVGQEGDFLLDQPTSTCHRACPTVFITFSAAASHLF